MIAGAGLAVLLCACPFTGPRRADLVPLRISTQNVGEEPSQSLDPNELLTLLSGSSRAAREVVRWLDPSRTTLRMKADGTLTWWTFAGARANACLGATLRHGGIHPRRVDNLSISFAEGGPSDVSNGISRVRSGEWPLQPAPVTDEALEGLKFAACLPDSLARLVLERRATDQKAVE
jgi:hypothetical protein